MERRTTLLWTLVVFFGASIAFGVVQDVTQDESVWVTLGVEVLVLGAIIAGLVAFTRLRR